MPGPYLCTQLIWCQLRAGPGPVSHLCLFRELGVIPHTPPTLWWIGSTLVLREEPGASCGGPVHTPCVVCFRVSFIGVVGVTLDSVPKPHARTARQPGVGAPRAQGLASPLFPACAVGVPRQGAHGGVGSGPPALPHSSAWPLPAWASTLWLLFPHLELVMSQASSRSGICQTVENKREKRAEVKVLSDTESLKWIISE